MEENICLTHSAAIVDQLRAAAPTVAVLTGAGASAHLGLPVMSGFFEKLIPDFHKRIHATLSPLDDMVLGLVRAAYPDANTVVYDLERVMKVITLLETGLFAEEDDIFCPMINLIMDGVPNHPLHYQQWAANVANRAKHLPRFRAALEEAKSTILTSFHNIFGAPSAREAYELLAPLLDWLKYRTTRCVPVFTINYDTAWERAFTIPEFRDAWRLYTGFAESENRPGAVCWSPSNYRLEADALWLFKLHGSSNWCMSNETRDLLLQPDNVPTAPDLRNFSPVIRAPVESKVLPSYRDEPVYHIMYAALEEALRRVSVLIVIGLSFRDVALKQMVEAALHREDGMRVVAVVPRADEWTERNVNSGLNQLEEHPNFHRIDAYFGKDGSTQTIDELQSLLKDVDFKVA